MTELTGKTLGNYRMDRLLGEGGMGAVYQAYDLALQREVAIKLIHPHLARRDDFRERFIQEARLMARLDHPGIVKVYVLGREGDLLFLPMEFIKGGNLRQLLDRLIEEKKWLPLNEALLLVRQLCQVVDYAHRHGVLHRDIKPANLMLKPEPTDGLPFRVILTDLGLAKLLEGLGITQEGTSLGTPAYMSPEQASGRPTDPRSDVYSLGILLYELAVGRLPFAIRTITEATRYHNQVPPPDPCSIRTDLPAAVQRIILKALEKEPDKRYASAAGFAEVLSGSLSSVTEIMDHTSPDSVSLVTEYQASVVAAPGRAAVSLMTVLGSEPAESRGSSVFGGQSIAPSSQTRIQVVHKEHTAKTLTLPSGTVTIGRDRANHIVLDDDKVSRRHAQITWDGLEYHVMDLNSSNGTYLENARLLPGMSEIFKPGQNLRIGDTWLRLIPPASQASSAGQTKSILGSSPGFAHSSAGLVGVSVTPQQLSIETGSSATVTLSLLNQSPNVDHFSISVTGIPNDWITSLPAGVQLMPSEQKETAFDLHVPRAPQSQAGAHPIKIKVTSQRDPSQSVEVRLVLTVVPYWQFISELDRQKLRSGQTARLMVSNQGNLQEVFTIQFKDAADELAFQPHQIQVRVPAGETAAAEFQVREKQRRWMGSERSHSFSAKVSLPKGEAQTLQGEMVSRGLVPVWIPPAVLFLCCFLTFTVWQVIPGFLPPAAPPTLPSVLPVALTLTPELTMTLTPSTTPEPGAPVVEEWCVYPSDQVPTSFTNCPVQLDAELGKTIVMQWRVSNASEILIQPFGNQPSSGNIPITVTENITAISLIAKNAANKEIQKTTQIRVILPSATPTLTSTATQTPSLTPSMTPTITPTPTITLTPSITNTRGPIIILTGVFNPQLPTAIFAP